MREIKFRLWDAEQHKMYDWDHIYDTPIFFECCEGIGEFGEILMQYTGLKDKNGKDIYEGDILKNPSLAVVKYENAMFVVGDYGCELYKFSGDNKEVIGNIYENPELLGGDK